ncbi:hypothetical protein KI387_037052 [Taxus chinensis]|uniref:Uncharacterized protein n=1 Tax=Taxus chinensis TaxID=29808 RepID=A0AA38KVV3_TAXCH|nr:hypothetical protein KI387_037052 [Taxus chinensis]
MGAENDRSSRGESPKPAQDEVIGKRVINNNEEHWEDDNSSEWDCEKQAQWSSTPPKTQHPPLPQELQLQLDTSRNFKHIFFAGREDESGHLSSDSEEEEEEEKEEEEGPAAAATGDLAGKEGDVYNFFEKVFQENEELKRLYVENCKRGLFQCAVCAATNGKVWRIYPNCAGLIQHSMTVVHTKSKAAHRGYGRAICALLGWNSDKFLGLLATKKLKSLNQGSDEGDNDKEADSDCKMTAAAKSDVVETTENVEEEEEASENSSKELIST